MHSYIHIYIHIDTKIYTRVYIPIYMHTYTHMYTYVCLCMYVLYTYVTMYVCVCCYVYSLPLCYFTQSALPNYQTGCCSVLHVLLCPAKRIRQARCLFVCAPVTLL